MDWGSLIGLLIAIFAILASHLLEGGLLQSLIQPTAFLVTVGGTAGAVILQFGIPRVLRAIRLMRRAFTPDKEFCDDLLASIDLWANTAKTEGLHKLDMHLDESAEPFMSRGLTLLADYKSRNQILEILKMDIVSYERASKLAIKVWEAAGGYAPTIGVLGAVMGLIRVMSHLGEPELLGAGIAIAFVSTLYGVGLSNLVFLPIANKLKYSLQHEVLKREMIAEALYYMSKGEHPSIIKEHIKSHWYSDEE
ncbi:MAG: flagellar motor protein [Betaproteobacteria bacterium]|jgi:chemotaxis protein MotA